MFQVFFLSLFLLLLPACVHNSQSFSHCQIIKSDIPLFIEMPTSSTVFDNISPCVYQAFYQHFQRLGYRLVNHRQDGYILTIKIKNLESLNKLISPDVLLFDATIRIELVCQLFNFDNKLITEKTFSCSNLISKPRSPILNSGFLDFTYNRLFARAVPKIEQYIRPFLLEAFK